MQNGGELRVVEIIHRCINMEKRGGNVLYLLCDYGTRLQKKRIFMRFKTLSPFLSYFSTPILSSPKNTNFLSINCL